MVRVREDVSVNSRKHSRLRRIQRNRRCDRVFRALVKFVNEKNSPIIAYAQRDLLLYGVMGKWSIGDDFVMTYDPIDPRTY